VSKALGKGLGALINDDDDQGSDIKTVGHPSIKDVSIEHIHPNPNQPRKEFRQEALQELADSVREKGVLQPILVEENPHGEGYLIIAGERRYRASKLAGLQEIPVIVKSFSEEEVLEIALIENIQREDLTPIEEAKAYRNLMESFSLSQEEVAKKVGKNRSTVANAMRLLKLPEDMQEALTQGNITPGHARTILSVVNPADQRILFSRVINQKMSVRDAEAMSSELNQGIRPSGGIEHKPGKKRSPELQELEQKFIDFLGTKVTLKGNVKKGKIEIAYYSMEDLERILEILSSDK